ncbi:Cthe_2314 family HEPN domain-containing protein [Paenibacillus thermotolerans]|uniref:Cthe_2314 family HEPN domain-containing protein n=1 Tax=Paenibacillus thermotolerans TaxID=3027807 RepID=UPI0023677A6E|nr:MULTISPECIES: Cthe_2314 family HEPN domain-containing protein [unclassified Paenibacillus]
MLRFMFGEQERRDDRAFRQVMELIHRYRNALLHKNGPGSERRLRLSMWLSSIAGTLDELEESVYCSERFAALIAQPFVSQMTPEETLDYRRHLYFFENGCVRVFSVLDKLGSFLNELYELRTEEIKSRFSYFTVIRRMRERGVHAELQRELHKIKDKYKHPMSDLRLIRNHEIHGMNAELLDENGRIRRFAGEKHERIEDLAENNRKLREGYAMVCESLQQVFRFGSRAI